MQPGLLSAKRTFDCRRRGESTISFVVLFALLGSLAVAAVVITPRALRGDQDRADIAQRLMPHRAATADHRVLAESLARIIGGSHRVLAVHGRGPGRPLAEVALWTTDHVNPGALDAAEVAIISHSRVMQTLTYYAWEPDGDANDRVRGEARSSVGEGSGLLEERRPFVADLDPADVALCARWRDHGAVSARVIGTGLSDVVFEFVSSADAEVVGRTDSEVLRIELTWGSDSVDAPDTAIHLVEVAR